jgi:hypothetical protein
MTGQLQHRSVDWGAAKTQAVCGRPVDIELKQAVAASGATMQAATQTRKQPRAGCQSASKP